MHKKFYRELNLNSDPFENKDVFVMKPTKARGHDLIQLINKNPGFQWMIEEQIDVDTIKVCAEEIIGRDEKGSLPYKIAKQVLKLILQPRTVTYKHKPKRK